MGKRTSMLHAATFAPDGKSIAFVETRDGNAEIYVMPFRPENAAAAFLQARNLTQSPLGDFRPAFSPDGQSIAFCSDRGVPSRPSYPDPEIARAQGIPEETPWPVGGDIYLMNADGSNPVRLTDADGWDGSPAWSKDGETIYFYSERDGLPFIWRMKPDGGEQKPLGGPPGLSPTVMDDGRVAFFCPAEEEDGPGPGGWRVFSVTEEGGDLRPEGPADRDCRGQVFRPGTGDMAAYGRSPRPGTGAAYLATPLFRATGQRTQVQLPDRTLDVQALHRHFPAISPDGREIVSSVLMSGNEEEGTHLIAAPVVGGEGREVYRPDHRDWQFGLSWSGDTIAFGQGQGFAPAAAKVDIWKVRSDGSEAVNLTPDSDANNAWPDCSAEAERIVFRSGRDGNFEIYMMDTDGNTVRRLTDNPARDTMPAISPIGDQVAFSSTRDGKYESDFDIYLLDLTETGEPGRLRRITDSPGPDMHVRFSPDGEWIVYTSQRGGLNDELELSFTDAGQPYGEIYAQRLRDGLTIRLTHNKWEDGPVAWGPTSLGSK